MNHGKVDRGIMFCLVWDVGHDVDVAVDKVDGRAISISKERKKTSRYKRHI